MKKLILLLAIFLSMFAIPIQGNARGDKDVKLVSWNGGKCKRDINGDRVLTHIYSMKIVDKQLHMSIIFGDNCCAQFNPSIRFHKDTLFLFTYDIYDTVKNKKPRALCGCDCCFSLDYVISNLNDPSFSFVTMFQGKGIAYSENMYPLREIKYEVQNGDTINRNNKYGTAVGLWKKESGGKKTVTLYANDPNSIYEKRIWTKEYYANGMMSFYERTDSTESWYEDGKIKYSEYVTYDDENSITRKTEYYQSGQLKSKSTDIFYAEKNQQIDSSGEKIVEISIVNESFYENGQLKSLAGDTTKSWFEDGKLKSWSAGGTQIEYYHDGTIGTETESWTVKSVHGRRDLNYSLYFEYYPNGKMSSLRLVRDEENDIGYSTNYYTWTWDENGTPVQKPKNWNGDLPKVGDK